MAIATRFFVHARVSKCTSCYSHYPMSISNAMSISSLDYGLQTRSMKDVYVVKLLHNNIQSFRGIVNTPPLPPVVDQLHPHLAAKTTSLTPTLSIPRERATSLLEYHP